MGRKNIVYRGSFTVEAALLMAVIVPLLTALIYLGMYLHDQAWTRNTALETAVRTTLQAGNGNSKKRPSVRLDGILGNERLQPRISETKKEVCVEIKGGFAMPGLAARFLTGGKLPLDYRVKKPILQAKKEIQKIRNIEKLAEGGKT